MLKKTSNNPVDHKSDSPREDFKRFEDAMKHIVKASPVKKAKPDHGKIAS
ncbi:hypothetical protein LLG46_02900 [bacterium]|nr:hypothetical protein [bacterium]